MFKASKAVVEGLSSLTVITKLNAIINSFAVKFWGVCAKAPLIFSAKNGSFLHNTFENLSSR